MWASGDAVRSINKLGDFCMHKKLLAVAVAGALALPGAALAASSVTITGFFKVSYAWIKISGKPNEDSQDRVQDESSRIYFRVVEDLGGGLQAIGQVDWRVAIDSAVDAASGANWVGLRSKSWGELTMGRHDLHYIYTEDQLYSLGGSLKATNTSIIAFSGTGVAPVAIASRTPNTVRWFSPNWNGFTVVAAYSTNPYGTSEAELGSTASGGEAWHIAPQYNAKNWGVGLSWYDAESDGTTTQIGGFVPVVVAAQAQGESWRFNGHYQWGNLRVGFVWDNSEWKAKDTASKAALAAAGLSSKVGDRDAWSIPIRYTWGKHAVFGHYSEADDDDGSVKDFLRATTGRNDTGAKMYAIGYAYSFSKRTTIAATYAKIKNDNNASYNLFTSAAGSLGSPDAAVAPGEDPSQFAITVTHNF
ncbi:MAG: porin [Burkholderiales bacterium]|nr:porin [Burkholderiales bacterium]